MRSHIQSMSDVEFVEWCYQKILRRENDESGRHHYLEELKRGLGRLDMIVELFNSPEYDDRFAACRLFPPGHPLSPLPSGAEIEGHHEFDWHPPRVPGVELRIEEQWLLLQKLAKHYPRIPFTPLPTTERRYYYENSSYSYADAILLGCLMLELKPQRIIEVGSGFSSAAMLDISDSFFNNGIDFLFIDPEPGRLISLLRNKDSRHHLMEKKLQEVPTATFDMLKPGDILFIDSSHVSKVGSDVNRIFFDILPQLTAGVFIHLHDVFYPFEYPQEWLRRGWVWNEQYLLHAFLQYNNTFSIRLLSSLMIERYHQWFAQHMPDCLKCTGGCLWLEKITN